MENNLQKQIFKKGSRTYFYSSLFFPKKVKQEVTILYAFVRVVDDFVDSIPQKKSEFFDFYENFKKSWDGKLSGNVVIDQFVKLAKEKEFSLNYIESFFRAMESDLEKRKYISIDETIDYMYGSAEVIGLMMAKIMKLKEESYYGAKMLGRSMQYINFVRDLNEDNGLGRQYLPIEEMNKFNLNNLSEKEAKINSLNFNNFIKQQLNYYVNWQKEAKTSFKYLPFRYYIPIVTASLMYNYTAKVIRKNPLVVYKKRVKPSIFKIILTAILIFFQAIWIKYLKNTKN
jgi:15-cis-phytoene synthase